MTDGGWWVCLWLDEKNSGHCRLPFRELELRPFFVTHQWWEKRCVPALSKGRLVVWDSGGDFESLSESRRWSSILSWSEPIGQIKGLACLVSWWFISWNQKRSLNHALRAQKQGPKQIDSVVSFLLRTTGIIDGWLEEGAAGIQVWLKSPRRRNRHDSTPLIVVIVLIWAKQIDE